MTTLHDSAAMQTRRRHVLRKSDSPQQFQRNVYNTIDLFTGILTISIPVC